MARCDGECTSFVSSSEARVVDDGKEDFIAVKFTGWWEEIAQQSV